MVVDGGGPRFPGVGKRVARVGRSAATTASNGARAVAGQKGTGGAGAALR